MKKLIILGFLLVGYLSNAQTKNFDQVSFLIGNWTGTGSGFGNDKSKIQSSFDLVMNGNYIEVMNDSRFEPTDKNPEGEHHLDKGFISFDNDRKKLVFRQFNNEGYINQYVLNNSLSNENLLVFETEEIENFVTGGKARWTIRKLTQNEIETVFDVSFGDEYSCFGTNSLKRIVKE